MTNPFTISAAQQAATQVLQAGNTIYTTLVNTYNRNYNLVWNNPNATADTVVTAMGVQATKVFGLSAAVASLINSAGGSVLTGIPPGWSFAANDDGSATLTAVAAMTSISPTSGPGAGGTSVTITGVNLTGTTAVTFGNNAAAITSNTDTQVVVTSPAGADGVVTITVDTPLGNPTATFTYND